jgi:integrase/recombinase XerD
MERIEKVSTKHAKVLDDLMFAKIMIRVAEGSNPLRDQVMLLLSYKAGLRSQEIAGLEWTDITDATGAIRSDFLFVPGDIAKRGFERSVPMNPHLYTALIQLRVARPKDKHVIYSLNPKKTRLTANAVTVWFHELYKKFEYEGCSSHSGRRTFITKLARKAGAHDCSIRDVMMLAGHRNLGTTESYVELSPNVGRLVAAI